MDDRVRRARRSRVRFNPRAKPKNQQRRPPVPTISSLDFVGIPSQDADRSRTFYGETLGLRPDDASQYEFWVGQTCLGIWEPEKMGMPFAPQKNAHLALHVDDVAAARAELEGKGVEFAGDTFDTGVCHMALFTDPDGNDLMLHHRYAPRA
jgi:predicted enzyme related to lactoylglutathione lyase